MDIRKRYSSTPIKDRYSWKLDFSSEQIKGIYSRAYRLDGNYKFYLGARLVSFHLISSF